MLDWHRWIPATVFGTGCLLLLSVQRQTAMPLRGSLETLPVSIDGFEGTDQVISEDEQRVAGMSEYVLRVFEKDSSAAFSIYVGYYEQQTQGSTIHSPKNCLPGAGWEALSAGREPIALANGDTVMVNRYELANKNTRALVYYWYQGRGRVEASEYRVKWDLLRDAALDGRSEEALVRIVVPIMPEIPDPDGLARRVAEQLVPAVEARLPAAA